MLQRCLLAVGLLLGALPSAFADTRLGESCDLSLFGIKDKDEFLRFDHDLRAAIETQESARLAPLILFPLRVNYAGDKHLSLKDDAGLRKQFPGVFSAAVRAAIAQQKIDALFCRDQGIMYGDGEIWIGVVGTGSSVRFGIQTVNMPEPSVIVGGLLQPLQKPLNCTAQKVQISIDYPTEPSKNHHIVPARYRAWNSPHTAQDKPDLELTGDVGIGKGRQEGQCDFRTWRFKNGNTEYFLSEPACPKKPVPEGARAELQVSTDGRPQLISWCY